MRLKAPTGAGELQKYWAFVQTPSEPHKRPRLCRVIGSSGSQLPTRIRLLRTSDLKEFMFLRDCPNVCNTMSSVISPNCIFLLNLIKKPIREPDPHRKQRLCLQSHGCRGLWLQCRKLGKLLNQTVNQGLFVCVFFKIKG